jgi:hypothetical protein
MGRASGFWGSWRSHGGRRTASCQGFPASLAHGPIPLTVAHAKPVGWGRHDATAAEIPPSGKADYRNQTKGGSPAPTCHISILCGRGGESGRLDGTARCATLTAPDAGVTTQHPGFSGDRNRFERRAEAPHFRIGLLDSLMPVFCSSQPHRPHPARRPPAVRRHAQLTLALPQPPDITSILFPVPRRSRSLSNEFPHSWGNTPFSGRRRSHISLPCCRSWFPPSRRRSGR